MWPTRPPARPFNRLPHKHTYTYTHNDSGPAPEGRRDGGLLARLGGKRGRMDDDDADDAMGGGRGRRGRSRSRSRGEEGDGRPRSRRRLASAVGAPDAGPAGTWEEVRGLM